MTELEPGSVRTLLELLAGKARAQAVSTAAALGIPDRLAAGPRTAAELARELGCPERALASLLEFLVGLDLCVGADAEGYALTELGRGLRSDALGPLAEFVGAPEHWDPWARLRDSLGPEGGGASAFELAHGTGLYPYLAKNPEAAERFDRAIDSFTQAEAVALCKAFDFGAFEQVVDIGGGRGTLLAVLLRNFPKLRATLFERPDVVERANVALAPLEAAERSVFERLEVQAGDFARAIPEGADLYFLKHVLHNLDDDACVELLRRCADAVRGAGRVLVVEALWLPSRFDLARVLDLEMLVLFGGRERKKSEYRMLFARAGLRLVGVQALTETGWLMVGEVRRERG